MSFVHLHTHSHYSLLDGLSKIDELIDIVKKYNMPALALTDHGVMYGVIEFYQKAKKAGIKPIIGVEGYVAKNGHLNKRPKVDERPYHLIMLAKNNEGYQNLMKLTTIAHIEGFYYKPRIDYELLEKYHNGIIAFFLEVQNHPTIPEQELVNEKIFALSKELGIGVIATNDSHYPNPEDAFAQDVLMCIAMKKTLDDTDRMSYVGEDLSLRPPDVMKEIFKDHPEVIENTLKIAEMCDVSIDFGKIQLPQFVVPDGKTAEVYLAQWCQRGLAERYETKDVPKNILDRLDYELSIIQKTGYASYFLIVADFINWAKNSNIVVGPGRGSAAGSLVAYLTKITDIDPIKYNLLFERFLNPERISMPDIDTDFTDTRRDEVLKYVSEKYGKDHVAQIITFGTMASRASIRDVGRAMGLPYNYCDKIAKMVPMATDLDEAIRVVPELKEILSDPQGKKLLDTARRVEGCVRHASTHACGVVITKDETDKYTPRQMGTNKEQEIMTQYEMHAIEDLGILKMDFLGLTNLTVIERTLEILDKALNIKIDMGKIPLDDKPSYELLQRGETTGVFQLESSGMKRYLKMLKPTEFEDIIAMVSLYRPGPMEFIPDYIDGKHKRRKVTFLDPKLKPILEKTYGIAVYQEQIMEIARQLAGFSYGEADVLRKAVGKKIATLLAEQETKIIQGMVKNGIQNDIAKAIWEFILPFARYGFNRSHAACYAMIAYQTAYLKAHYPSEFMASLLTSDADKMERIAVEINECRSMGLEVLPPDINESFSTFTVVYDTLEADPNKSSKKIRFGLNAVKNLGENVVKEIIRERKAQGQYKNLEDFLGRVKIKDLNKKSIEALIKSGAMDRFGERNRMLFNMEKILNFIRTIHDEAQSKQPNLFGLMAEQSTLPRLQLDDAPVAAEKQKLSWEKELLGLYLSSHPMHEIEKLLLNNNIVPLETINKMQVSDKSKPIKVVGVISSIKKIITKKGEPMLFVKIEDTITTSEVLVFPSLLRESNEIWVEDSIVMLSCRVSDKDGEAKLICNKAKQITKENAKDVSYEFETMHEEAPKYSNRNRYRNEENFHVETAIKIPGNIHIHVPETMGNEMVARLKGLLVDHSGQYQVYLIVKNGNVMKKIVTNYRIDPDDDLKNKVRSMFGDESIIIENNVL
ncbi:MAG: polymerase III DnaE protein [Parcubacteria group bacterium GW2011_GWA2_38_13]|nr:MAG: polymerase III DnaE protein [Parcubacteria group bacterium GW2011_GWA2_38_13]